MLKCLFLSAVNSEFLRLCCCVTTVNQCKRYITVNKPILFYKIRNCAPVIANWE